MTVLDRHKKAGAARQRGFTVRALGEVAIRCEDVEAMADFYQDVIGLELYARRPRGEEHIVFLRLGESFGGHTAVIALFPKDAALQPHDGSRHRDGPLHHIALSVAWEEQARIVDWYKTIEQPYWVSEFAWTGWRGIFTHDPEGNMVELVAADPTGARL